MASRAITAQATQAAAAGAAQAPSHALGGIPWLVHPHERLGAFQESKRGIEVRPLSCPDASPPVALFAQEALNCASAARRCWPTQSRTSARCKHLSAQPSCTGPLELDTSLLAKALRQELSELPVSDQSLSLLAVSPRAGGASPEEDSINDGRPQ